MTKIGFIGAGNMGSALAKATSLIENTELYIYDKDEERAKRMKIGDYPYIVPPIKETGATREFLVAQLDELVRVYDKESADKAAEKISELKKRLPFPTENSTESNHHSEIKRLIEAQFYGSEALEKEVLGRGGC